MNLKVISTGSQGNAYVLENNSEALLIECGVRISDIKLAIGFDVSKVVGCIVTHEHNDHSQSINELLGCGIDVYASVGTHEECKTTIHHRARLVKSGNQYQLGNFRIKAFDVKHDAAEPVGYLIEHPDCGKVLFITDTYFCKYTFKGLNNIIIEANYSKEIIDRKYGADSGKEFLRNRILKSHFSLENCKDMLAANDLTKVNNIVLIHLSDSNSNEDQFKREVSDLTGKNVTVARAGLKMPLNKTPF